MHNEKFVSLSEYKCLRDRLIIVGGFSKTYAMCGYRLGYIASSINIIKYINRIQGQTIGCPSSISQNAALNCFGSDIENWINTECKSLVEKKNYIMGELSMAGINYIEPNAAFYIFVEVKKYFNKNIKNSVKFILQKGTQDWPFIISQTPSDPIAIYDMLQNRLNVEKINIYAWDEESMIDLGTVNKQYEGYPRIIFVVKKIRFSG